MSVIPLPKSVLENFMDAKLLRNFTYFIYAKK
jgi:hypothetical protein